MTDIRLMSPAELTELNERGREWRAQNAPAPAANADPEKGGRGNAVKITEFSAKPNTIPSALKEMAATDPLLPEASAQLAFGFLADPVSSRK
jgi:hypothetical protein